MKNLEKVLTLTLAITLALQFAPLFVQNIAFGDSPTDFAIRNINMRSSADTVYVYPGSKRVDLKVEASYQNSTANATNVVGWLKTTEGIGFSSGSGSCSPARLLNGSVAQEVSIGTVLTFEYLLDVPRSVENGTYELVLNITYVKEGIMTFEVYQTAIKISPYPTVSLRVVDAYFSPAAYPGSVDTNLYVVLENNGSNTINSANFNVTLPEGLTVKNPWASTGLVNKGDRFTLTFTGVAIPVNALVGAYIATIYADCSARTDDGVAYSNVVPLNVPVMVENPPPEQPIMVASVNTLYNGAAAPLLPSARGVVLRVYLINRLPDTISAMAVIATLPNGMAVRGVSGTYINGMAPGGTCFVDLTVDVNFSMDLGENVGELNITYLKIVSGASFLMNQAIYFPINVESAHSYISELVFVEAYWGYPDPTPVYSTSRYVPLTVRLANYGRYAVWGIVINASSQHLVPIKDSEACATTVASGGSCTAVLYFDVNNTAPNVSVKVFSNYIFTEFGTNINVVRTFTASLPIESYPASDSLLSLVSAGWQNNVNVFPRTNNATYQVTLANRAPHSIGGLNLQLALPAGITSEGKSEATAYFEGPVRSLATFTAAFTVSIGAIQPGSYESNLTVDCTLLSGGPGVRRMENFSVQIGVNDDGSALEILDSRWYEGSVGPNTYGAHLIILVRNVYVDSLHGAVLELNLPKGIFNAADNSSHVKATPLSVSTQLPQALQTQNLAEILSAFLNAQQASPTQVYSRGDILTFMVSLNLLNVEVGNCKFDGLISYIDTWGSKREIPLTIQATVLGRVDYIEISMDSSLRVRSRYVNASLTLVNRGSSPAYDAYVVVSPHQGTPILIASPAVNHIGKINPRESCQLPLTLAYNPLGFYSQSGTMSVTYGPVPLMVSIIYRDASGYSHTFNNSITVIVEPFIELTVTNIRATGTDVSSTVTGIIVNYGSSTARCVEAELKIGDKVQSYFIGDIDPGSEVAFRVDMDKYNDTAILTIKYLNVFNEQETKETTVSITSQEKTAPPPTQTEQWPIERWIIVAGVIVFLAVATVMIYRMMKKTRLTEKPESL